MRHVRIDTFPDIVDKEDKDQIGDTSNDEFTPELHTGQKRISVNSDVFSQSKAPS